MNKGDLANDNDNKAHARKGKRLVEFNAKDIFKSRRKLKVYFYCQNQFFALYHVRWNDMAHQAAQ